MADENAKPSPIKPPSTVPKKEDRSTSFGCLFMGLGFLVTGLFLLWMFFSGAPTKRGNPLMGLIGGALFSFIGLVALASGLSGLFRKKR